MIAPFIRQPSSTVGLAVAWSHNDRRAPFGIGQRIATPPAAYQERMRQAGRCPICGRPDAAGTTVCRACTERRRAAGRPGATAHKVTAHSVHPLGRCQQEEAPPAARQAPLPAGRERACDSGDSEEHEDTGHEAGMVGGASRRGGLAESLQPSERRELRASRRVHRRPPTNEGRPALLRETYQADGDIVSDSLGEMGFRFRPVWP